MITRRLMKAALDKIDPAHTIVLKGEACAQSE
jgi:hypothetical protein